MTRVLLIFLDGIGLGDDDPAVNPFAVAHTPTLHALAGGRRWLRDTPRTDTGRALFIPTDPRLGVPGRPQSATGQAAILTGRNVPAEIGEHYGPRPNPPVRAIINEDNVFKRVVAAGGTAALIDAYPPRFHALLARGKRLPSSIQQAVLSAGLPLLTEDEVYAGTAMSSDWTGQGWRDHLGYTDTPLYTRAEAGSLLARLAMERDFTLFSHWFTDEIGPSRPPSLRTDRQRHPVEGDDARLSLVDLPHVRQLKHRGMLRPGGGGVKDAAPVSGSSRRRPG